MSDTKDERPTLKVSLGMGKDFGEWLIPPGNSSSTGVPKPAWYDQSPEHWPPSARTYFELLLKGIRKAARDRLAERLAALTSEEFPKDPDSFVAKANDVVSGERFTISDAWPFLENHERKQLALAFSDAFDVDLFVYPGGNIDFRYPRIQSARRKR